MSQNTTLTVLRSAERESLSISLIMMNVFPDCSGLHTRENFLLRVCIEEWIWASSTDGCGPLPLGEVEVDACHVGVWNAQGGYGNDTQRAAHRTRGVMLLLMRWPHTTHLR